MKTSKLLSIFEVCEIIICRQIELKSGCECYLDKDEMAKYNNDLCIIAEKELYAGLLNKNYVIKRQLQNDEFEYVPLSELIIIK